LKFFPYPLIVYTLSVTFGIALHHFLRFSYLFIGIMVVITFCLWLYAFLQTKQKLIPNVFFGVNSMVLSVLLGITLHAIHIENQYKNHYSHYQDHNLHLITGSIRNEVKASKKQYKYIIDITSIDKKTTFGKALLYIPKEYKQHFIPDDQITFQSLLAPLPQNLNPYQFDYGNYLKNQQIYSSIFLNDQSILYNGNVKKLSFYLYQIRRKLLSVFESFDWNQQTTAVVEALILGNRFLLDEQTVKNYQNAGVVHILAISGLHVGILYFIIAFITNPLKRLKQGVILQFIITLFLLWSFALLTGFSPSVSRSVTLFSLVASGKLLNRTYSIYNLVAASALLLLLLNPNALFDVGFQLSYAAVLSILLFNPFFKYFQFSSNKIIKYFIDIVLVSLAAQIGVLPLSILYFNQFPTLFLLANIVVIPLITLALILSLSILIFYFIIPSLSNLFAIIVAYLVDFLNSFIGWLAQWQHFIIQNIAFNPLLCLLSYLSIFGFLLWCYHQNFKNFKWFLASLLIFQLGYFGTIVYQDKQEDFIIFNSRNSILVQRYNQHDATVFTNNPEENSKIIIDYQKGTFTENMNIKPLPNTFFIQKKRCLIVDSSGIYKTSLKPDIVVLTQNSKINLERLIKETHPERIIADGSNSYFLIKHWKLTCRKEKIPFHVTSEKGFYKF